MKIFDYKKYHFIGIGGIGVSAIAKMLFLQGKEITGSDSGQSEITGDLQKLGVKVFIGQKAENLEQDVEVVIYSVAIERDNPEILEAQKRNLPCFSYPEALGELSKEMFTIAISGTHGKTTTTAMLGHILKKAGLDPTVVVGSKILGENSNFLAGKSKYLIVEACEYKRSFLNLHPSILVITNIEADHLDYYKDFDDIKSAFKELEQKVPKDEFIIKDSDYKKVKTGFTLLVSGEHNVLNAQAAIKTAEMLGIPQEKSKEYLADFKGTWRRLEYKGEKNGNIFYDDYAHHPTEIKASLLALREKHPDREIVCVFEPHQQCRLKLFFNDFIEALRLADIVFVAPIFITRETDDGITTNKTLADAINKFVPSFAVQNPEELKNKITHPDPLLQQERESDTKLCVVFRGAGNIYKWTSSFI
ncbi:MAG: UDP-N-acetylmuramate--L-alanine ligase [Candidatus Zambryskibacteria bacterium]